MDPNWLETRLDSTIARMYVRGLITTSQLLDARRLRGSYDAAIEWMTAHLDVLEPDDREHWLNIDHPRLERKAGW